MKKILLALLLLAPMAKADSTPRSGVAPYLADGTRPCRAMMRFPAHLEDAKAEKGTKDFSAKKDGALYCFSSERSIWKPSSCTRKENM